MKRTKPHTKMNRRSYETKQRWKGLILFHRREVEGRQTELAATAGYYFTLGIMIAAIIAGLLYFYFGG